MAHLIRVAVRLKSTRNRLPTLLLLFICVFLLFSACPVLGAIHTVTPSSGSNGVIYPESAQLVETSFYTTFSLSPDPGFTVASAGGTCGGDLYGTTYVSDEITADCTVEVSFEILAETAVHYVAPGGLGDGTISSPQDLQSALDAAKTNGLDDFIYLAQGTYDARADGADTFIYDAEDNDNQAVTLSGGWDAAYAVQSDEPSLTVLDGGGTAPVLHLFADQTGVSYDFSLNTLAIENGQSSVHGGGIATFTGSTGNTGEINLYIQNCIFQDNSAINSTYAGAIYTTSYFEIQNTIFRNNTARYGGALFIAPPAGGDNSLAPVISNCLFEDNHNDGGAQGSVIYNSVATTITNSIITGSHGNGSPIYTTNNSFLRISDSLFYGNIANYWGSVIQYWSAEGSITNSLFYDNIAGYTTNNGYAAVTYYRSSTPLDTHTVTILNSTFVGNRDASVGSAAIHNRGAMINITNSIFWDNEGSGLYNQEGTSTISNSIAQGGAYTGFSNGGDNLTDDPLFENTSGLSSTWDLHLTSSSLAVDSGNSMVDGLPASDLDHRKRIFDGDADGSDIVDMGAYEYGSTWPYTLYAYAVGGNGTVSPMIGLYHGGTEAAITAVPDPGYRVKAWDGTDDDTITPVINTVTIDGDKTVTVQFEEIPNGMWSADYGDPAGTDQAFEAVFDLNGQVVAGGQIFIGNGTSGSGMDAHGVRFDTTGDQVNSGWPVIYDKNISYNQDRFFGVAVDSSNNIIFSGLQTIGTNPQNQFTIWKYDEFGEMDWVKTYSEDAWNAANEVCVDSNDNVFAAGYVFTGWTGRYYDWHIHKWDSGGTELKKFNYDAGNTEYDQKDFAYAVDCDSEDNIITGGQIGISGTEPISTDHDWHVRKYPNDLDNDDATVGEQPIWEYTYRPSGLPGGGARNDVAIDVATDSNNDVYVGGYINQGTDNASNADHRGLIIKLAKDGDGAGAGAAIGPPVFYAEGTTSIVYSIGINEQDRLFVGGYKKVDTSTRWHLEMYDSDLNLIGARTWPELEGVILGVSTQGTKIVLSGYFDNRIPGAPDSDNDWKVMVLDMAGDINGDGVKDLKDAIITLDIISGGQPEGTVEPFNTTGTESKVKLSDAVHVLMDFADTK